jgi:hypothetical protein
MKKTILILPILLAMVLVITQCINKNTAPIKKAQVEPNPQLMTHQEAADTLLADSTAPLKPLQFKAVSGAEAMAFFQNTRLDSLFVEEYNYPKNGFYGDDRYRIEIIFTEARRDTNDPSVYHLKGKNRHKKVITAFEGTLKLDRIQTFVDPNIDTSVVGEWGIQNLYALGGRLELKEDPSLQTSGLFSGAVKMELSVDKNNRPSLWYFSQSGLPSGGAGYRFDGTWASYTKKDVKKPVIFAADIFRFANDVLKDFSIGERDVEINEQYRHLGWDNFWENEEWWAAAKKPEM